MFFTVITLPLQLLVRFDTFFPFVGRFNLFFLKFFFLYPGQNIDFLDKTKWNLWPVLATTVSVASVIISKYSPFTVTESSREYVVSRRSQLISGYSKHVCGKRVTDSYFDCFISRLIGEKRAGLSGNLRLIAHTRIHRREIHEKVGRSGDIMQSE